MVGVRRRCRAPSWVQHSAPGKWSTCYDMLRFPVSTEILRAWFSAQLAIEAVFTSVSLWSLVGRHSRLNCILKHELRCYEPRSRLSKKPPFRPHFEAFSLHPAHKSSLSVAAEGATHLLAPRNRG